MTPAGDRVMSVMSPITVAATTCPTPKTPVTVVPDARIAAVSFLFEARS